MPDTLEERLDKVERQNIRIETILEQYEKRFGQVEAAMNRLTWTVSLWGGVIDSPGAVSHAGETLAMAGKGRRPPLPDVLDIWGMTWPKPWT